MSAPPDIPAIRQDARVLDEPTARTIGSLCDEIERLRSLCGDLSEAVALVDAHYGSQP